MKLLKAHFNKTLAGVPSQSPGMSMRDVFLALLCCMAGFRETQGFFPIILKQFWDGRLLFNKVSLPWLVTKLPGKCMTTHRLQEKTKATCRANNEQSTCHDSLKIHYLESKKQVKKKKPRNIPVKRSRVRKYFQSTH